MASYLKSSLLESDSPDSLSDRKFFISIQIWNNNFSNFFNYGGNQTRIQNYKINCLKNCYYLIKINGECKILAEFDAMFALKQFPESLVIFKFLLQDNLIYLIPSVNSDSQSFDHPSLWRIIKPHETSPILEKGGIIKLAQLQFLIKDIVINKNNQTRNDFLHQILPSSVNIQLSNNLCKSLKKENSDFSSPSTVAQNQSPNLLNLTSELDNSLRLQLPLNIFFNSQIIKSENNNSTNPRICRICLGDDDNNNEPLISPCNCKGTLEFIHLSCLRTWLKGRLNIKEGCNSYEVQRVSCELCNALYPTYINLFGIEQPLLNIKEPDSSYLILERLNSENNHYIVPMNHKKRSVSLGRASNADVRVSDMAISRYHSYIKFNGKQFSLQDNDSKFGTLVQVQNSISISSHEFINLQFDSYRISIRTKRNWKIPCFSTPHQDISFFSSKFRQTKKFSSQLLDWNIQS